MTRTLTALRWLTLTGAALLAWAAIGCLLAVAAVGR